MDVLSVGAGSIHLGLLVLDIPGSPQPSDLGGTQPALQG